MVVFTSSNLVVTALLMANFHGVACDDWYQYITCIIIQGIAGIMVYKQVQEWSLYWGEERSLLYHLNKGDWDL